MTTEERRGGGQPEVGGTVRYRAADGTEHNDATITGVTDRRTVDLRLADGTEVSGVEKGGQAEQWRPPEGEADDDETETEEAPPA